MSDVYKVRLVPVINEADFVKFDVTPEFSENRSVEYTPVSPIHMPGSIQVYKNTGSRTFSIGATLISRTWGEAQTNRMYLQLLRSWTMPHFGEKSATTARTRRSVDPAASREQSKLSPEEVNERNTQRLQTEGYELLGAPPMVLYLYAYSTEANNARKKGTANVNRVPVVITNMGIVYPQDVDYISSDNDTNISEETEPFPVKMTVNVEVVETHSPREYEQFSIADFRDGKLVNF